MLERASKFFFYSHCLAISCLHAQEGIKASLVFNVWDSTARAGLQMHGNDSPPPIIKGIFFIKIAEQYLPVSYQEGRKTEKIQYQGPKTCILYREAKRDGQRIFEPAGQLVLPSSGDFLVLLQVSRNQLSYQFSTMPIAYGDQNLRKGSILFQNLSSKEVALKLNGKPQLSISPSQSSIVKLPNTEDSAFHLELFSRKKQDAWKVDFSRSYSIYKNAKTACILYQDQPDGAIRLKMFSGIDE